MTYSKEDGYMGEVKFEAEGHKQPYVLFLHSKKGGDWGYGLHFLGESGDEEEIVAVDEWLENDDEAFDELVEAAKSALPERG